MFIKIVQLTRHLFGSRDTEPKAKPKARRKAQTSSPNSYHAVSVHFSRNNACEAVAKLGDTRLLASQAPTLPLPGCTNSRCKCIFVHHRDRRSGPRRDADVGVGGAKYAEEDRRGRRPGRRKTDDPLFSEADDHPAPDYFSFAKKGSPQTPRQDPKGQTPPSKKP